MPRRFSRADVVTLTGYACGLWFCGGGPAWAALASVVADEVDGRLARRDGTASARGSAMDWGADVALTPAALGRLGVELGVELLPVAPVVLAAQASLRARGRRPRVGSARAVVMLAAVCVRALGGR